MILLKVTKTQGFTLSLEDTVFGKPKGGGVILIPLAVNLILKYQAIFTFYLHFIYI